MSDAPVLVARGDGRDRPARLAADIVALVDR